MAKRPAWIALAAIVWLLLLLIVAKMPTKPPQPHGTFRINDDNGQLLAEFAVPAGGGVAMRASDLRDVVLSGVALPEDAAISSTTTGFMLLAKAFQGPPVDAPRVSVGDAVAIAADRQGFVYARCIPEGGR